MADHQDILRSLGKTVLIKLLVKKTVSKLEKDKRTPETEIVDELNDQVRKWGIDVQNVKLSDVKVLKQPESGSDSAVGSILKGLGMKDDPKYPTPQEFVSTTYGLDGKEGKSASLLTGLTAPVGAGGSSQAAATGALPPGQGAAPSVNMSMLQSLSQGQTKQLGPGITMDPNIGIIKSPVAMTETLPSNWGRCLEVIMASEFGVVEQDAHGVYQLIISETENGTDTYFIDVGESKRSVLSECPAGRQPDVSMSISSSDLGNVLDGSLAPLQVSDEVLVIPNTVLRNVDGPTDPGATQVCAYGLFLFMNS